MCDRCEVLPTVYKILDPSEVLKDLVDETLDDSQDDAAVYQGIMYAKHMNLLTVKRSTPYFSKKPVVVSFTYSIIETKLVIRSRY